jgi:putative restriction endonuclease
MADRIFGDIPGCPEGTAFPSRKRLSEAGVHRPLQAGISGSGSEGADSIVLSGGYEDDEDYGDLIIYTGHGGRDPDSREQVDHQTLTRGNLALAKSRTLGLPIRVVRGAELDSDYAPAVGYRYDGLYRVEDYWRESGRSGYYVWRYRLIKTQVENSLDDFRPLVDLEIDAPQRTQTTVLRIVRDTKQSKGIKELYDYRCQVCGIRLEGSAGPYAESAHIKPLGAPHNGPDIEENILCLCPNHHILFDLGGFFIADDFSLIGIKGRLIVNPEHQIGTKYLKYHREHYPST